MYNIQFFMEKDKNWFRNFAEKNGITFKQLRTEIFPHANVRTLESLWQKRSAAHGAYADALIWYAQAKRKKWEGLVIN
jgi:hypothetical protein